MNFLTFNYLVFNLVFKLEIYDSNFNKANHPEVLILGMFLLSKLL